MMNKRLGVAGVVAAVALLLSSTPAGAAPPSGLESYAAGARATALQLDADLLNLPLLGGFTLSEALSSGPTATAGGSALATPLLATAGAPAAAPDGEATNQDCALDLPLPAPLDNALVDIGCVDTAAIVEGGAPGSTSTSDVSTIDIKGGELTTQLLTPLLEPLIAQLPGIDLLESTIPDIVSQILNQLITVDTVVLRISVASNGTYTAADDVDGVVAHAIANGATIELLPSSAGALLTVTVGKAEASVVRDAVTGAATPTVTPATLGIVWGGFTVPTLAGIPLPGVTDLVQGAVNDLVEQLTLLTDPLSCDPGSPLATVLCIELGTGEVLDAAGAAAAGFDYGPTTIGARAGALRISLLDGGIILNLSEAIAAAAAVPVQAPPTTPIPPPPSTPTSLARTGGPAGNGTSGIAVLTVATAAAGLMLLRRRALATAQ